MVETTAGNEAPLKFFWDPSEVLRGNLYPESLLTNLVYDRSV